MNFLGTLNNLLYTAKERISKMDDSSEKSTNNKTQRDKNMDNMWDWN